MDHTSCCFYHRLCCSLVYLLTLLPASLTAEPHVVCPSKIIFATQGQDVLLPCRLEPQFSIVRMTVEWTKPGPSDQNRNHVHLRRDGREVLDMKDPSYSGRTSLFADELENGNVSLKLFRVRSSDAGQYRLFIPKLRSHMKEAVVQLIVDTSTQKLAESGQVEKQIQMNADRKQPERRIQGDNSQDQPLIHSQQTAVPHFVMLVVIVVGLVGGIVLSALITYFIKKTRSLKKVPESPVTTAEDLEKLPC